LNKKVEELKSESRGNISWFQHIDVDNFDQEKLTALYKILLVCGERLNFIVYSQYKYKNMLAIQKDYIDEISPQSRGLYDVDVNLSGANKFFFVSKVRHATHLTLHIEYRPFV